MEFLPNLHISLLCQICCLTSKMMLTLSSEEVHVTEDKQFSDKTVDMLADYSEKDVWLPTNILLITF